MVAFYWHIHHNVLVEPRTEPIEVRIDYISQNKPASEIEQRLNLMQPVRGELPARVIEAGRAFAEAWDVYCVKRDAYYAELEKAFTFYNYPKREVYHTARDTCSAASKEHKAALQEHKDEIEALHRQECPDCPWDGKTIFPVDRKEQ